MESIIQSLISDLSKFTSTDKIKETAGFRATKQIYDKLKPHVGATFALQVASLVKIEACSNAYEYENFTELVDHFADLIHTSYEAFIENYGSEPISVKLLQESFLKHLETSEPNIILE